MYLKKKISALVLIAVIACGAAGCKGNSNDPDDSYKTDRYIPTVEDATAKLNEDDKEILDFLSKNKNASDYKNEISINYPEK